MNAPESSTQDTTSDPSVPEPLIHFRRYREEREIGRGGMGVVLLAHDVELGLPVALKMLPEAVARDAEAIAGLKAEVLKGMALTHPGIVRVHNFERDERGAAVVMEYVPGSTLSERKTKQPGGCFDCETIRPWLRQLAEALDYAHEDARIAHRDLKPRNVIVNDDGRLKIADFGLASALSESLTRISTHADSSGTPPYMSPQQAMGKPVTRADDIYALGATVFELLAGKPPFFRGNVFAQVIHSEPPSMAQRREELDIRGKEPIPQKWERAVAACLAKDSDQRPKSAAAFVAMLDEPDEIPDTFIPSTEVRVLHREPLRAGDRAKVAEPGSSRRGMPVVQTRVEAMPAQEPTTSSEDPDESLRWQPIPKANQSSGGPGGWLVMIVLVLVVGVICATMLNARWPRQARTVAPTPAVVEPTPIPGARSGLGTTTLQVAGGLELSSSQGNQSGRGSR